MRSALWNRVASAFVVAGLLGAVWTATAEAQTAGKIQGQVVDEGTNQPLAGAQINVVGTQLGAITDDQGRYFLNFVPAGVYDIRAQFIGYRTEVVTGQRVLAGQTTDLNFRLESAPVEVEPLVVVGERNPLVPRDQVSSKAIITGEDIDALPVDNPQDIILLQPGVINTNSGRTIRGSRPNEESVYIDGVIVRRYASGEAQPVELPTNSLEQVDVTTGGIGARFGEAQSGVVNYVTRSGGPGYKGAFSLFTDQAAPNAWRTYYNRMEGSFSGPVVRDRNISFFIAGIAEGRKYGEFNDGFRDVPLFVPTGVDTTIMVPRSGSALGATDSVAVTFPTYERWDNGRTYPFQNNDRYTMHSKLSWEPTRGSNVSLSYTRERAQNMFSTFQFFGAGNNPLGSSEIYNPEGWDGFYASSDVLTLGGYFLFSKTAGGQVALDLKASYQRHLNQSGEIEPGWLNDNRNPFLGFNLGGIDFLADRDDWPVTDALIQAVRSGVMPAESLQIFPGRFDLASRQTVAGIDQALRLNPYGLRRFFEVGGFDSGTDGMEYRSESTWWFSGVLDWQLGRYNRIQAGGDLGMIHAERQRVPLFTGTAIPELNEPLRAALFFQNRLDIGDMVIDAGLRWDFFDPDGVYSRVPGFVFNVPDSLKADFVRVESGAGPILDRVVPLEDCGGAATAPQRTNPGPDGALGTGDDFLVCKPNFIAASTKSDLSPRLGVSFPVTDVSTFRLSYSHNVQVPALYRQDFGGYAAAPGQVGLFSNGYADFQGGLANTNADFGRDVDLPRTVTFEAGYRQLIGEDLVVDGAIYSKTTRNGLTIRKLPFGDPNNPAQTIFINVITNGDYAQIRGLDLKLDKRFSQIADFGVNYSFVDARGTGSDPYTYIDLIFRQNTNLSIITGEPVIPPDALLQLEQSRQHNIAGTLSLLFPPDYREGSPVGQVLGDLGVYATFRLASGLRYTRLRNDGNGQTGPPTDAGLGGTPVEELSTSTTPWERRFDLRLTKGFRLGQQRVRVFADWRNPLDLLNTETVYMETGTTSNAALRDKQLNQQLTDPLLDGDSSIDDFDILAEAPPEDNALNRYSLLQAEARFGDGDGFFTVAEQRAAFGAWYDLMFGPQNFQESNQNLRLGFEITF